MCDQKHNFSQEFRTTLLPQNASEKCIAEKYTVPPPSISKYTVFFTARWRSPRPRGLQVKFQECNHLLSQKWALVGIFKWCDLLRP